MSAVLIAVGTGSRLAKAALARISGFDELFAFSTSTEDLEIGAWNMTTVPYDSNALNNLRTLIDHNLPKKNSVSRVGLVCFAGRKDTSLFINDNEDSLFDLFRINFHVAAEFSRVVIQKYLGIPISIIFISSSGALLGTPGTTGYSSSKHALDGLSRSISVEYGRHRVTANCLALGLVDVGLGAALSEKTREDLLSRTSTRRPVSLESVIHSLQFLFDNQDVAASTLYCDGGYI